VGSGASLFSAFYPVPASRRHVIRVDIVVVDVIRVEVWIRLLMFSLVGRVRGFLFLVLLAVGEVLEELGQASHQLVAAADDVQAAFVLMLFQDFMQTALEFTHDKYLPRIRRTYKLRPFGEQRKFEILMGPI
jgi:hypothetical protein